MAILTAATVSKSNTLQQYFHALALPYLFWHSSVIAGNDKSNASVYTSGEQGAYCCVLTVKSINMCDLSRFMITTK